MAKFNKAFIPLGISGAFVAFGLVGSLAINAAYNVMYVPEEIVIESAGGEDVVAETPEELSTKLKSIVVYDGAYYAGLETLPESEPDPVPEEGKYNSLAITCVGGDGSTMDRKLVITQNHLGAFYQYDGWHVASGLKITQNTLIGYSRHGMFTKFNNISVVSNAEGKEVDEMNQVVFDSIQKTRGNWYKVACSKASSELPVDPSSWTDEQVVDFTVASMAAPFAESFYKSFKESLSYNSVVIAMLISFLDNTSLEELDSHTYRGVYENLLTSYNVTLHLDDTSAPVFVFDQNNGTERQTITLQHIDNTKVRIVQESEAKGDYFDMLKPGLKELYEKQKKEYEAAMAAK